MKNRLALINFVQFATIVALLAAVAVMSDQSLRDRATDAAAWVHNVHVDVPTERQRITAAHEAAHEVTSAVLRGISPADHLKVFASTPRDADSLTYGEAGIDVAVRPRSRIDALRLASVYYAGVIGERMLFGTDMNDEFIDSQMATVILIGYRLDVMPASAQAATNEMLKSPEAITAFLADMHDANVCALTIVSENAGVIRALADEIMDQPVRFARHYMNAGDIAKFFSENPKRTAPSECFFAE